MLGGPGIGTAIGAGIGAAASITMYVVHVIRRATQGPEPGEEGWRTSAPASAGPGTSSTWSEIYKKSEEQGQTAADTFLEAWGDHWKKAVENVGIAGAIKMFAGEFDKLETTIGEASRMGADMKHLWIGAFNELSKGLTDSQKKALFAALGLKAFGITLEDVGKKASESTPLLKPMGKTIYDIVRDFISKADEAQKELEKHALDPEALSEDLSTLGDIYDEAKSYLDQIESLKKAGLLPENWGEVSMVAGAMAPLERLRAKIKEWGILLGKEGVKSINIAEERAASFFDNAKKWVDAFTNAKEGSLAWLIAQEQLNSILEDASAKAQEFTDQGKPIPENLAHLIEQLEKLGITLKETGADDLYARFEKVKEALASTTKGSDEWIAEFSKIPSLFNEATALAQLYEDAQQPIPAKLAAIIDEMIQLDPALASSRSALDLFIDAVEDMAVGVASAAGSLSASIADIVASIAQAANVGDVLKGVEALSGSYSYLRGKMDELERTMTSPEWGKLPPEAQAKIQESYNKLAEQLANAIPPGKTYAEIQREQEEAAKKAAQEQKRMAQEAASAAKRAAEEAKRAAEEAARKAQDAFKHMFEIPALEALQKGNWEEAAKAVIGLAQHRQDVFKLAQSLPEVNGKALDLADVFGLLKNASSKLLSSLQDQIDIMQLAGENTDALEKMKIAIEGVLDPLTKFKYSILNAMFGDSAAMGRKIGDMLRGIAGGLPFKNTVPRLASGGTVKSEGFAYLDPGEVVIPADVYHDVSVVDSSDSLARAVQAAVSAVGTCATGTCQLSKKTQEEINKARTDIKKTTEEYTSSCQKCAQSNAQLAEANQVLETIPNSLDAIIKQFEASGLDLSDAANQAAVNMVWLHQRASDVRDALSWIEQTIEDLRMLGMVEEAESLQKQLDNFRAGLQKTTVAALEWEKRWTSVTQQITDLVMTKLKDSFHTFLAGLLGLGKAVEDFGSSLNIPTGYKVERAAWAAAKPGEPGIAIGAGEGAGDFWDSLLKILSDSLVEWTIGDIVEKLVNWAITDIISPITEWFVDDIVTPILDWFITDIVEPIAFEIGQIVKPITDWFITDIVQPLTDWVITNIITPLTGGVDWFITDVIHPLTDWTIEHIVKPLIAGVDWYIQDIVKPIADWTITNIVEPLEAGVNWFITDIVPQISQSSWAKVLTSPDWDRVLSGLTEATLVAGTVWLGITGGRELGGWLADLLGVSKDMRKFLENIAGVLGGGLTGALLGYLLGGHAGAWIGMAAGSIAGIIASIPHMQGGGYTVSEGLAYLHPHELVLPAAQVTPLPAMAATEGITIHNYLVVDSRVLAESVNRVARDRDMRMSGSSIGGRAWRVA